MSNYRKQQDKVISKMDIQLKNPSKVLDVDADLDDLGSSFTNGTDTVCDNHSLAKMRRGVQP